MAINEVHNVQSLTITQMEKVVAVIKSIKGLPNEVRDASVTFSKWKDGVKLMELEMGKTWLLRFHRDSLDTKRALVGRLCICLKIDDDEDGDDECNWRRDYYDVV